MNIILKKVKVQDIYSKHHLKTVDIAISEGKIIEIEPDILPKEGFQIQNFQQASVSVGWFDMRVFNGEPGFEQKENYNSLQNAASHGGFTDIAILPNSNPILQSKSLIENIIHKCKNDKVTFHPIAPITVDFDGVNLTEMMDLHHSGAVAFTDIHALNNSNTLQLALQYVKSFNGLIMNQPLDKGMSIHKMVGEGIESTKLGLPGIPAEAEELMIERDLKILEYTGGKIHFSLVNTAKGIQKIKEAKEKGLNVTCDTAIHYLVLSDEHLRLLDANYKVMPPLRTQSDIDALRLALKNGIIDAVVSNHEPQNEELKDLEFDIAEYGIGGIETLYPLLISFQTDFLDILVYNPRKILAIDCPIIEVGFSAKLTIFNNEIEQKITKNWFLSNSKNSPFINKVLKGKVLATVNNTIFNINA